MTALATRLRSVTAGRRPHPPRGRFRRYHCVPRRPAVPSSLRCVSPGWKAHGGSAERASLSESATKDLRLHPDCPRRRAACRARVTAVPMAAVSPNPASDSAPSLAVPGARRSRRNADRNIVHPTWRRSCRSSTSSPSRCAWTATPRTPMRGATTNAPRSCGDLARLCASRFTADPGRPALLHFSGSPVADPGPPSSVAVAVIVSQPARRRTSSVDGDSETLCRFGQPLSDDAHGDSGDQRALGPSARSHRRGRRRRSCRTARPRRRPPDANGAEHGAPCSPVGVVR